MPLPEFERVVFGKAPLTQVLAQVRFPVLPRFADGSFIAPFHDAIRADYPAVSRDQQVSLRMALGEGLQTGISETKWRLATRDRSWVVTLGETALTLESTAYRDIDDFLRRFGAVLEIARKSLELEERVRLGLRYVNQIRHPDAKTLTDWSRLLRPEFVGFASSDLLGGDIEHMVQELRVTRDDGVLAVRHGLISGAEVMPPGTIAPPDSFYLVDLDYFDATEIRLDTSQTLGQARGFSDFMYRLFRWSLGDRLFEYLEPANAS